MFVTTRDAGGRRRSKGYATSTTAKSSKTSLLSLLTVNSAGSGDSGSTVTQSSYNRSQQKRRKRPKENRQRTNEPFKAKEKKNKSVDVFDFLVEKHASKESLPIVGQSTAEAVENDVESESADVEEPEEPEETGDHCDLSDPEESDEAEEPDEQEELDEIEEPEDLEELEEVEDPQKPVESEQLEEAERVEDSEQPDEVEEDEEPTELEYDEDGEESADHCKLGDPFEHAESATGEKDDSENDHDGHDCQVVRNQEDDEDSENDDDGDNEYNERNDESDGSDGSDESDAETSSNEFDHGSLPPNIVVHKEDSDPEVYYRSMSDSGISMGSCSIDASIASLPPRLPMLPEEPHSRPSSSYPRSGNELAVVDPRWTWNTSPGPLPEGFIPPPAPVPPPMMYEMPIYPAYPPYTPYGTPPPMPEDEIRGPAIKIREPSHLETKPKCFRSFTKMSARLILQLQDDIAELEGELSVLDAELDAIEADSSSDEEAPPRRGTARHMLKARECEIYQELQHKLDQYSSSLESMQKIENISQPAVTSDLTKHHRWLESRISPSYRARHLVGNDLRILSSTTKPVEAVTVAPAPAAASASPSVSCASGSSIQDTQFMAYSALVNTLFPLVAFKLVDSVLSRLILLIIIVIIGASVQDRTRTAIRADDMNCILVSVGISVFAAFFL